jgi:hypothetical protein
MFQSSGFFYEQKRMAMSQLFGHASLSKGGESCGDGVPPRPGGATRSISRFSITILRMCAKICQIGKGNCGFFPIWRNSL